MRSFLALIVCLLLITSSYSATPHPGKNTAIIVGTVVDSQTRGPLPWATVEIAGGLTRVRADDSGKFRFVNLSGGEYSIRASHVGYESRLTEAIEVHAADSTTIVIKLTPLPPTMKSIVVTPGSYTIMGTEPTVHQTFSRDEIATVPQLGDDLLRSVTRLPGMGGNDFSTRFEVRGGEFEEVLLTLDGLEIHEPFHLKDFDGGCVSVVDASAVDGIDLMTGGFSAKYGDKMSGVFNIRSRSVPPGKSRVSGGFSLTNLKVLAEGSFEDGRGTWLVSARRGFMDLVLGMIDADESLKPQYYDFFGKTSYQLNRNHVLSFDILHAGDDLDYISSDDGEFSDTLFSGYSNTHIWMRLNSMLHPRLTAQTLASVGRLNHDRRGQDLDDNFDGPGMIVDETEESDYIGLKTDFQYEANDRLLVEFGLDGRMARANYDYLGQHYFYEWIWHIDRYVPVISRVDTTRVELEPDGRKFGAYVSSRFRIGESLTAEAGWRFDHTSYSGDNLTSPRLGMVYEINPETSLRVAWGKYYQMEGIHEIAVVDGEDDFFPAQRADHYVVGLEHQFPSGTNLRVEAYYKKYRHLRPDSRNPVSRIEMFPELESDRQIVHRDGASARGVEVYLKRDVGGKLSWYASLAHARVKDSVRAIYYPASDYTAIYNRTLSSPRDIRNTLYLDVIYRPAPAWQLNLAFQYHTGWPYTSRHLETVEVSPGVSFYAIVPDEEWGARYEPFHRLDFRLNRFFSIGSGRLKAFIEVLNIYGRENVRRYSYSVTDGMLIRSEEYWFGTMPSLGVSYEVEF